MYFSVPGFLFDVLKTFQSLVNLSDKFLNCFSALSWSLPIFHGIAILNSWSESSHIALYLGLVSGVLLCPSGEVIIPRLLFLDICLWLHIEELVFFSSLLYMSCYSSVCFLRSSLQLTIIFIYPRSLPPFWHWMVGALSLGFPWLLQILRALPVPDGGGRVFLLTSFLWVEARTGNPSWWGSWPFTLISLFPV